MRPARHSALRAQALAIALGTALAALLLYLFGSPLNLRLQDWLLRTTTSERLPDDFLILAIDGNSLKLDTLEPSEIADSKALQLMRAGWPFSREVYGMAAKRLLDAGARLVIFDLVYPGPKAGDEAFADILRAYPGRIIIGSNFNVPKPGENEPVTFVTPTAELAEAAQGATGFVNLPDAVREVRHALPYAYAATFLGEDPYPDDPIQPSLAALAAGLLGHPQDERETRPRRFRYSVPDSVKKNVPLSDIFVPAYWETNLENGKIFKDKVVLVGATAPELQDFHMTPFGRLPGPEIQLHILAAMLRNSWLSGGGPVVEWVCLGLAALGVFVLAIRRKGPRWLVVGLLAGMLLWMAACLWALKFGAFFLPMASPLVTWLVCGFAAVVCDVTLERRERSRLRGTLERYVSRDVVHEIVENPESFLHILGGERKEVVVLFSDLKGFTSDSEHMDPAEMVAKLNEYFGEMVQVVFQHRGTLDKFIGDALMATWGGFGADDPAQNAQNAVGAVMEMRARLAAINVRRQERGEPPWDTGAGLALGPAIFGNIGSQEKMEISVIGDTVNLASRLEGLTRTYGVPILINERLASRLADPLDALLVDVVRVKGRKTPEKLYVPYLAGEHVEWGGEFAAARAEYLAQNFAAARDAFAALESGGPGPGLAALYRSRCERFVATPPPADWSGIWGFSEK